MTIGLPQYLGSSVSHDLQVCVCVHVRVRASVYARSSVCLCVREQMRLHVESDKGLNMVTAEPMLTTMSKDPSSRLPQTLAQWALSTLTIKLQSNTRLLHLHIHLANPETIWIYQPLVPHPLPQPFVFASPAHIVRPITFTSLPPAHDPLHRP